MTTEQTRTHLMALLNGLTTGRAMEVFEQFYADDVVMMENAVPDENRVGKEKNRAYEQYFVDNSEWHDARIGPVIVDGDHSAYEMYMDLSFQGQRFQRTQVALQTWKDGKIIREVFYYKG